MRHTYDRHEAHFQSRMIQDCVHKGSRGCISRTLVGRCQVNKMVHKVLQATFGSEAKLDSSLIGVGTTAHINEDFFTPYLVAANISVEIPNELHRLSNLMLSEVLLLFVRDRRSSL